MKIYSSYAVELLHTNEILLPTVKAYQDAIAYLIRVIDGEWSVLQPLSPLERLNVAEHLIHRTKQNEPKYDFDAQFPSMPPYLRRAAIQAALGNVSSYRTNQLTHPPRAKTAPNDAPPSKPNMMPVFYQPQMYSGIENGMARIKILQDGKWIWHLAQVNPTDLRYLERHWSHCTPSAPSLERRHRRYYLRFTFMEEAELDPSPISPLICAVRLGVDRDAVCCIMDEQGSVSSRQFVRLPEWKEKTKRLCNRIGTLEKSGIYSHFAYAKRVNEQYAIEIAHRVLDFAKEHGAKMLVCEVINPGKQQYVKAEERLRYLRRIRVQELLEHQGHRSGIRLSRVDGRNADVLSFDGSEKAYNADLAASYNLGARHYIREILKSLPERERSRIEANVPDVERSASCTLSTLRDLQAERRRESRHSSSSEKRTKPGDGRLTRTNQDLSGGTNRPRRYNEQGEQS